MRTYPLAALKLLLNLKLLSKLIKSKALKSLVRLMSDKSILNALRHFGALGSIELRAPFLTVL